MQPYFFPYVGYFELIQKADIFVFLSNVQYINRGWVNRNRIRSNDKNFHYLTVPILKCSQKTLIKDVIISYDHNWHQKHLSTLLFTYGKKIKDNVIYEKYKNYIINKKNNNLNYLNQFTVKICCEYLGINTQFKESCFFENSDNPTKRILKICSQFNTTEYINANNGSDLYSQESFENIKLTFMPPTHHLNKFSILDLCLGDNVKSI